MNKEEINWLKEHLYEIYKYKKSFGQDADLTYDMNVELLNKIYRVIAYLQQENQQLKDNWNKLKQKMIDSFNESQDVQFLDVLQDMQELESGDSNE